MNILLTGGAGYIGSHTCVELLNAGHRVVVFDNFSNSNPEAVRRVKDITGKYVDLIKGEIRDRSLLETVLRDYSCDAVIHLAGLKSIGESVEKPISYYDNNVAGTICLLEAMQSTGVNALVFSSSATVYGDAQNMPISEDHPLSADNPYGRTKLIIENMLRDWHHAKSDVRIIILRYFNPVGAHPSGLIGEDPRDAPNNLMPLVAQVAGGRRDQLNIWGNDYQTPDGTGIRDYIHVVDLALGHLHALMRLDNPQCIAINLATGRGYSVLDVVRAFEAASGHRIPYTIAPRRLGDVAISYADPSRAQTLLGWLAKRGLDSMCADQWRWQQMNPNGYVVV